MGLDEYIAGQTPLDEDEKEGLLIPTIIFKKIPASFYKRSIFRAEIFF
jgi:hypothetical protein